MATTKQYSVVGVTIQPTDGQMKIRFADDHISRIKILHREGHTDIRFKVLDQKMSKYDAVKFIQSLDEFQDAAAQSVIADYLQDNAPKAPKQVARPAVSVDADTETVAV
jgi:hypothetical protein